MQQALRESYERIYAAQMHHPLYGEPWWLDATCGHEQWDVFQLTDHQHEVIAILPYHRSLIRGMNAIINPPVTQWLPLLRTTIQDDVPFEQFPRRMKGVSILDIAVRPEASRFISSGSFKTNLKYSYIIPSNQSIPDIRSGYNEGLRRNLKEAVLNYSIVRSDDLDTFIQLCISTYRQRGMKAPWWIESKIPMIWKALIEHQAGQIELAFLDDKAIAGIMTGWDDNTCYYLIGGRVKGEGGASAHSLLLDQAIQRSMDKRISFDFEGSMNPGIANFFQSFGAKPEAYWQIRQFSGMGKLWSLFH